MIKRYWVKNSIAWILFKLSQLLLAACLDESEQKRVGHLKRVAHSFLCKSSSKQVDNYCRK
jgi:hypothetical protein